MHAPKNYTVFELTKLLLEEYMKNPGLNQEAIKYPHHPEGIDIEENAILNNIRHTIATISKIMISY